MSRSSDTPIHDALKKIDIPAVDPESVTLAAEATRDDVGVTLEAEKDLGQPGGWSAGASASWWKNAGYTVKSWLRWRGKKG